MNEPTSLHEKLALEVYKLREENNDLKTRVEALEKENTCLSLMNYEWVGKVVL
ncbi:hypothetical protein [Ferviditalea candida]|uniref:Transposase n=1 Tax=Ferviditalea candida TaxID=3108399 RepID=A0ABU5ZKJ7_9BACL|nr:hypothetical protein [Paenibacillaceae bacterium T2]